MSNVKKVVVMVVILAVTGGAFANYTAVLFHMDEGTGDTLANAGTGNDGSLPANADYKPTWSSPGYDAAGSCLAFAGNDYASVNMTVQGRADMVQGFSLGAQIDTDSLNDYAYIMHQGGWQFRVKTDGSLMALLKAANGFNAVFTTTTTPISIGAGWQNVEFSIDAGLFSNPATNQDAATFLVDGVPQAYAFEVGGGLPVEPLGIKAIDSNPIGIGGAVAGPPQMPFHGLMDEVIVTVVPEPATMILLGLGGLIAARRRKA